MRIFDEFFGVGSWPKGFRTQHLLDVVLMKCGMKLSWHMSKNKLYTIAPTVSFDGECLFLICFSLVTESLLLEHQIFICVQLLLSTQFRYQSYFIIQTHVQIKSSSIHLSVYSQIPFWSVILTVFILIEKTKNNFTMKFLKFMFVLLLTIQLTSMVVHGCICSPQPADPVCGTDGKTYENSCILTCTAFEKLQLEGIDIKEKHKGPCIITWILCILRQKGNKCFWSSSSWFWFLYKILNNIKFL